MWPDRNGVNRVDPVNYGLAVADGHGPISRWRLQSIYTAILSQENKCSRLKVHRAAYSGKPSGVARNILVPRQLKNFLINIHKMTSFYACFT